MLYRTTDGGYLIILFRRPRYIRPTPSRKELIYPQLLTRPFIGPPWYIPFIRLLPDQGRPRFFKLLIGHLARVSQLPQLRDGEPFFGEYFLAEVLPPNQRHHHE
jgi:hypothetical protein